MSKEKVVKIGLGEAVSRLLSLELTRRSGLHPMPEIAKKSEIFYLMHLMK